MLEYVNTKYPEDQWTHACTDGSAAESTPDGEGGAYIRCNDGEAHITKTTGKYSTNFKAEAETLKTKKQKKATIEIRDNLPRTKPNVVIFTDALCPQQAPKSPPEGSPQTENCPGQPCSPDPAVNFSTSQDPKIMNKQTGLPGKEASQTKRTSTPLILMKILSSKPSPWKKRKQQHQNHNQLDSVHKMNKPEQVILFKLRAGHKVVMLTMYDKSKAGVPLQCRHHDCRIYIPNSTANYMTLWGETCRQNQYLWWTSSVWQPGRAEEDSCFHESHICISV